MVNSIPLEDIVYPKYFKRDLLGDITALADSIKDLGLLQLPVLRKLDNNKFEVIIGLRRIEAIKLLGWDTIPAIVVDVDDNKALKMCLAENLARKDLTLLEEAKGFLLCMNKFNMTMRELSRFIGKSKDYVRQALMVFNIPEEYQPLAIRDRKYEARTKGITVTKIRTIAPLKDNDLKREICNLIITRGISRRKLEEIARNYKRINKLLRSISGTKLYQYLKDKLGKIWGSDLLRVYSLISDYNNLGIRYKEELIPYHKFKNIRQAEQYAANKGGFCTGIITYKYWRVFVPENTAKRRLKDWKEKAR